MRLSKLDAQHRFLIALDASLASFLLLPRTTHIATRLVATWDVFCLTVLSLTWLMIAKASIAQIRRRAQTQDVSHRIIFTVVIFAATLSLVAVGLVLGPSKAVSANDLVGHVGLSVMAIMGSWLLVNTVFSLHYAHLYYGDPVGGLDFPGGEPPDYLDFAYFSFVIGMTWQVSDVQITAKKLRRWALLHSMLSFGFNTFILALSINALASLL